MDNVAWNPHGWIAFPLETIAKTILQKSKEELTGTFLSANNIEAGTFVEAMFFLLRVKNGLDEHYDTFARKCQPLCGQPIRWEDKDLASDLLNEFRELVGFDEYSDSEYTTDEMMAEEE